MRGGQTRLGPLLAAQRRERAQELLLLLVELARHLDLDVHVEVAAPRGVQVPHAEPLERHDLAGLGAGAQVDLLEAVQGVELQDGATRRDYTAREVSGEERALWWERAVAAYPPYAEYQQKTDRLIPVLLADEARTIS